MDTNYKRDLPIHWLFVLENRATDPRCIMVPFWPSAGRAYGQELIRDFMLTKGGMIVYPLVAFPAYCRHFFPVICRRAKRRMRTSDCFVWGFEISAIPVLPPLRRPFGTIHQTKETFSMMKCPNERRSAMRHLIG